MQTGTENDPRWKDEHARFHAYLVDISFRSHRRSTGTNPVRRTVRASESKQVKNLEKPEVQWFRGTDELWEDMKEQNMRDLSRDHDPKVKLEKEGENLRKESGIRIRRILDVFTETVETATKRAKGAKR